MFLQLSWIVALYNLPLLSFHCAVLYSTRAALAVTKLISIQQHLACPYLFLLSVTPAERRVAAGQERKIEKPVLKAKHDIGVRTPLHASCIMDCTGIDWGMLFYTLPRFFHNEKAHGKGRKSQRSRGCPLLLLHSHTAFISLHTRWICSLHFRGPLQQTLAYTQVSTASPCPDPGFNDQVCVCVCVCLLCNEGCVEMWEETFACMFLCLGFWQNDRGQNKRYTRLGPESKHAVKDSYYSYKCT